MGYKKIPNHYRPEAGEWLAAAVRRGEKLQVAEKVHGTSASLTYLSHESHPKLHTGQGGPEALRQAVDATTWYTLNNEVSRVFDRGIAQGVRVYGEHYGGKIARSNITNYGPDEGFVAFEVAYLHGREWRFLGVRDARTFCTLARMAYTPFEDVETLGRTLEDVWAEVERLAELPSYVARQHGVESEREGVVIRSFADAASLAKYVRPAFRERQSLKPLPLFAPLPNAALELVTEARVAKVAEKLGLPPAMTSVGAVIEAVVQDILAESDVAWEAKGLRTARGEIAKLYKALVLG